MKNKKEVTAHSDTEGINKLQNGIKGIDEIPTNVVNDMDTDEIKDLLMESGSPITSASDIEVNDPEEVVGDLGTEETRYNFSDLRNVPYVKEVDDEGNVLNQVKRYPNYFPNRRTRKATIRKATKHPKNNKKAFDY